MRRAKYFEDYKLHVWFSDGVKHVIDFGPFLRQSQNPLIRKYLDVELFKRFTVAQGDLYWNDYDLCFPVADLYERRLFGQTGRDDRSSRRRNVTKRQAA